MKEYLKYLKRVQRTRGSSLLQLHKCFISREVARSYGVTEEEILQLDKELSNKTIDMKKHWL